MVNTVDREKRVITWTIAGSDSGGGAGIQADLATMTDLGCHACSVITAVTAQSSVTVNAVESVSASMLSAQLDTLLEDLPPAAIKIGLLANQEQINLLATWLKQHQSTLVQDNGKKVAVILDPVMVATCGASLSDGKTLDFSPFKSLLTLITPNTAELSQLTGQELNQFDDCLAAAKALSLTLDCAVLAKGGDIGPAFVQDTACDIYVCGAVDEVSTEHQHQAFTLTSPRINTQNSHGTGCTLSSAITSVLAKGFVLNDAIVLAKAYINKGLIDSYQPGQGAGCLARTGWPTELALFPKVQMLTDKALALSALSLDNFAVIEERLGLYPVVSDVNMLSELLVAGAKTIQLRIKDEAIKSQTQLEQDIVHAIALGRDYNARVFINDHWQLAIKHQAFGVHLGQEDLYTCDLKAINAAGLALGLSSHSYFEILLAAQLKPSYIAFGHIFPTTTKVMPSSPQGLYRLRCYVSLMQGELPLVAIGGIDASNLAQVKATGIDDIAIVRAVTQATEPAAAFKALKQAWENR